MFFSKSSDIYTLIFFPSKSTTNCDCHKVSLFLFTTVLFHGSRVLFDGFTNMMLHYPPNRCAVRQKPRAAAKCSPWISDTFPVRQLLAVLNAVPLFNLISVPCSGTKLLLKT